MKLNQILTASILASTIALPVLAQSRDPFCVGFYELRDDRYGEAVNSFSRAIRSAPQSSEAYFYRGYAHYEGKRYPEALANYNKALSIGLTSPKIALTNRATTLAKMGDYGQAIEDLKLLIQMGDREYEYLYRAIAHSYVKLGNRSAAIAWLQKLESKYYNERSGTLYLRVRDTIKNIQSGKGYEYFGWRHMISYEYGARCRR